MRQHAPVFGPHSDGVLPSGEVAGADDGDATVMGFGTGYDLWLWGPSPISRPDALGGVVGKGSARLVASFVPGFGSVVRAGVAASVTEAVGWAVLDNLEQGESL